MDLESWACNRESAPPWLFSLLSKVREGTREGEFLPPSGSFSESIELCSARQSGRGEEKEEGEGRGQGRRRRGEWGGRKGGRETRKKGRRQGRE